MKKLVAVLSLTVLATATLAGGWDVTTPSSEDGSTITYSIVPETLATFMRNTGLEVAMVVEISNPKYATQRRRLRVSGCEARTGKVALANMDFSMEGTTVFDWDAKGPRVYDMLAVNACSIWWNATKEKAPAAKPSTFNGKSA
jgi:hypothetical protein